MKFRSIRTLTLGIMIPAVLVAMIALSLLGYTSARHIIEDAITQEMELSLSVAQENIEKSLARNRKVSEMLAEGVRVGKARYLPADYGALLTSFIDTNDETFGGGIWFEPYAFDPALQYFSPYCMRENGKVVYVDNYNLGEGVYYTDQDWYQNVTNTQESAVWSAPYFDDFVQISMVTSSSPIYDETGRFTGVATTDIDLTEMQRMVTSLQVHGSGRAFLIDQSGTYIADADSEKLLKANITQDANASFAALGQQMISNKNGAGTYTVDGETYLAWYSEVPESGWIIATTISEKVLMQDMNALRFTLFVLCAVFALLLSLILALILRRAVTAPLGKLARVTREIADGNLAVSIDSHSNTEIGVVSRSLTATVSRLKDYIAYIDEVSAVLHEIADGNLHFTLTHEYTGEFGKLKEALLKIQERLTKTLHQITDTARVVSQSSGDISDAAQQLSGGSAAQADSVHEMADHMQNVLHSIQKNAAQLLTAEQQSGLILTEIEHGDSMVREMAHAMQEIDRCSGEIGKIIKTVEDIAFQTNILALNAAVEAARAGTAGKGFAVVADEVRNLANKSQVAAQTTSALIADSMSAVKNGTRIAADTATSMSGVVDNVKSTASIITEISQDSQAQLQSITDVDAAITRISDVVSTNSAMAQESAAKSEELLALANNLYTETSHFRLTDD